MGHKYRNSVPFSLESGLFLESSSDEPFPDDSEWSSPVCGLGDARGDLLISSLPLSSIRWRFSAGDLHWTPALSPPAVMGTSSTRRLWSRESPDHDIGSILSTGEPAPATFSTSIMWSGLKVDDSAVFTLSGLKLWWSTSVNINV